MGIGMESYDRAGGPSAGTRGDHRLGRCLLGLAALVLGLTGLAEPASADWRLYTTADIGYSVAIGDADGVIDFAPPTLNLGGDDTDVSPLVGGAFGIAIPMDEIAPIELPRGWRLPDWDVRGEIEAIGLREYEFKTDPVAAGQGRVLTEVDNWTVMANFWVDVPLRGLYRPISWTSSRLFGRWRLRTLKYALDRTTIYMGAGVGVAYLDAKTSEADNKGNGDDYNFAWQAGAGFGFQVSDRVNLSLGYRYLDPDSVEYDLVGGSLPLNGQSTFEIDPEIHEARAAVRVEIWDFATPWR